MFGIADEILRQETLYYVNRRKKNNESGISAGLIIIECSSHEVLCEWVLGGIVVTLREVVVDLVNGDTHVLENLPQVLTSVLEHNGCVVRIVLLDEDVTIEAAHVLDTEGTDRTE